MNMKMTLIFGILSLILNIFLLVKTFKSVNTKEATKTSKDEWIWFDSPVSYAFCLGFYFSIPCLTIASLSVTILSLIFNWSFWACASLCFASILGLVLSFPYALVIKNNKIAD